jgi:hypothetical protein
VIVGKDYYEPQDITPERTLEAIFAFLLRKKVPRQTEGACALGKETIMGRGIRGCWAGAFFGCARRCHARPEVRTRAKGFVVGWGHEGVLSWGMRGGESGA